MKMSQPLFSLITTSEYIFNVLTKQKYCALFSLIVKTLVFLCKKKEKNNFGKCIN